MKTIMICLLAAAILAGCAKEYETVSDTEQAQKEELIAALKADQAKKEKYRGQLIAATDAMFENYESALKVRPAAGASQQVRDQYKNFLSLIAADSNQIVSVHTKTQKLTKEQAELIQAAKQLAEICQAAIDQDLYDNSEILNQISQVSDLAIQAAY